MSNMNMGNATVRFVCVLCFAMIVEALCIEPLCEFNFESIEKLPSYVNPTLVDKDSFENGIVGNGLEFTGMENITMPIDGQWVNVPLTVSGFFRIDHSPNGVMATIASFYTPPRQILAVKIKDGRLTAVEWSDSEHSRFVPFGPDALEIGSWHHITWQMSGTEWTIYLDGEKVLTLQSNMTPESAKSTKFLLGGDYNGVVKERHGFYGMLDEFRIDDGCLEPEEVGFKRELLSDGAPFKGFSYPGAKYIGDEETNIAVSIDVETQSFVIDGKKEPVMMYAGAGDLAACYYTYQTAKDASDCGMRIFRIEVNPRDYRLAEFWQGPGKYEFTDFDLFVDMLFRQNPDALLLLQMPMSPPPWWGIKYGDEETKGWDGERKRDYRASHSFSSEKWLVDLREAYQAFFEHYNKSAYVKRTIGYVCVIGRYNEAFRWGYNGGYTQMTDYSKPEVLGFQRYSERIYGTPEKRNATRPKSQSIEAFSQIHLPPPSARLASDGYFIDPFENRNVLDYRLYWNANHAEKIGRFTDMIREFAGPEKVIGLYYGYLFSDSNGHGRTFSNESGHYALGEVLKHANVDFLLDSMSHFQREIGDAGPTAGVPAACRLNGKLWLDEADIRTHIARGVAAYSGARNIEESLGVLWRAFGTIQINRTGSWWFPIEGDGDYSHPQIWDAFRKMYDEMAYMENHPVQEDHANTIAFIMDSTSFQFRKYTKNDPVCGNLITGLLGPVAKAGFDYDLHIMENLETIPDDYKVYVFLNSFFLTAEQRKIISERFQQKGKLVVWTYAAGYFTNEQNGKILHDVSNCKQITGMEIAKFDGDAVLPEAGINEPMHPLFFVDDKNAEIWKRYENTNSKLEGKAAIALKTMENDSLSMYIGIPLWTPELLKEIARIGGVHVYTDDKPEYVLRVGNGHILLHSDKEVQAHIKLTRPAKCIVDVMCGQIIGRDTDIMTVPVKARTSRYLRIEE